MPDPRPSNSDGPWRRPRVPSWPSWLFWGAVFYLSLVGERVFRVPVWIGAPLSIVAAIGLLVIGSALFAILARAVVRWTRRTPVAAPPPPEAGRPADTAWVRAPRPTYPVWAEACGQCGWVALRLRLDRRGRVKRYQVTAQAPGRMFEGAVREGLRRSEVTLTEHDSLERTTVIVFVTPSADAPEWAQRRLAASAV